MTENKSILIIDDELQIRKLLEITLGSHQYNTIVAVNGKEALVEAASHHPDLILLDLGLPDIDGLDLIPQLRIWYDKPIIVLSVRNAESDIIQALDKGANDYISKPFRSGELLARIRAAIRASDETNDTAVFTFGDLFLDIPNRVVKKKGIVIKLTSTEFALLALFVKNRGRVLTHQFILKEIWGFAYLQQTQYLRVFVAQLRKKIEDTITNPQFIITESGIGYRFRE
jgi:two-component system KDP operon response regulator KdpE